MGADVELRVLPGRYGVARLERAADLPAWAQGEVVSITRTPAELTVVCAEEAIPGRVRAARGWVMLAVAGPLDAAVTALCRSGHTVQGVREAGT